MTSASFPGSQNYAYGYDAVGNLTSITKPSGSTALTYSLADKITTSGYAYDDAGALTADPARTYAYDGFGRLASTTLGATATSYTLDGAGNRTAETTGGSTISFDLDLRSATPTLLGDGTRRYLPGDPAAGYEQGGVWWSALVDQTGSAHSYVSTGGSQSTVTRYDPFGAARPGSTLGSGIGFAAEWRDPAGLVNLRARAYDPALGRFTSRDSFGGLAGAPQTANRYSYALNGPYRYADPSGHFVNALYANRFALVSLALAFNPVTAVPYGLLLAVTGVDPITGYRLSGAERFLAALPALGKAYGALARAGDGLADASRLGRAGVVDDVQRVSPVPPGSGLDDLASGGNAGSIRLANPTNGQMNCVMCAVATDARLRGAPASALPGDKLGRPTGMLEDHFGSTFRPVSGQSEVEAILSNAGEGARGIVFGMFAGRQVGHVFNAVNQKGTIRFLDGQAGGQATFLGMRDIKFMLIPSDFKVRTWMEIPKW